MEMEMEMDGGWSRGKGQRGGGSWKAGSDGGWSRGKGEGKAGSDGGWELVFAMKTLKTPN